MRLLGGPPRAGRHISGPSSPALELCHASSMPAAGRGGTLSGRTSRYIDWCTIHGVDDKKERIKNHANSEANGPQLSEDLFMFGDGEAILTSMWNQVTPKPHELAPASMPARDRFSPSTVTQMGGGAYLL